MSTKVKDIYSGKPDARDEWLLQNNKLLESFIMPANFNIEYLLSSDKRFIRGYKGSGKTALLLYINNYVHTKNPETISTFVYF